ncbi:MAG: hypothetical protein K9J37_00675 [Saprospiraceae bacterium]|nr:hypothetical protein [Saprospiraceae bacterium]MCF8248388.1 hypothetical protein [Saprospiraceae bacterium]MCF8280059.1 hypothetical protein [Bacteroidales bacterium]MCF8309916.1 hypothetical protein [Saprospiraceae bacterium]MCF8438753.1 hypothetical protein [Saprospiraceae bacterium]
MKKNQNKISLLLVTIAVFTTILFVGCVSKHSYLRTSQCSNKFRAMEVVEKQLETQITLEYLSANTRTHYFPCTDFKVPYDKLEQQRCGDESFIKYIDANLNIITDSCNSRGTIIIEFDVRKDGNIGNVCLTQDIGNGCGDTITNILKRMPVWTLDIPRHRQFFEDYKLYVEFK